MGLEVAHLTGLLLCKRSVGRMEVRSTQFPASMGLENVFYRSVDGNCLRCYLIFTAYENNEHHVRSQVNGVNEVNEDAVTELKGRRNRFLDLVR